MAYYGSKTDTLEDAVLSAIFLGSALPSFTDLYVSLCTGTPTETAAGTAASYGGYARVAVPRNTTYWDLNPGLLPRGMYNKLAITFPTCTSGTQTITHFEIWTAASFGTRLYYGILDNAIMTAVGWAPEFPIRSLSFIED